MPPKKEKKAKKGGKGKKKKAEEDPNALTEVDKTFYELTIADLNRKLARLRTLTQELELKNEELETQKNQLDEDRADIITYLKRMLQEKTAEINELEERIIGLQEQRQNETEKFEAKIEELEQEYKTMHEQLTSENKLLEGKLNSLEEFRSQRDELMKKFEAQEKTMESQDKRHARELYEIERKFIISKDKLKKDMEARLLQLSTEFHDASEIRIAATTHKVIRENIAVNNELDAMLMTHQKLYKDHQSLKNRNITLKQEAELHESEKNKALSKVRVQLKVIEQLTADHRFMKEKLRNYKQFETEVRDSRNNIRHFQEISNKLEFRIKLLEQNIHKLNCDKNTLQTDTLYLREENDRLNDILMGGVSCIKEALTIKSESDMSLRASKREDLLNTLFTLLSKGHEKKAAKRASLETITSVEETYKVGDLGFIPKPVEPRPIAPTRRHVELQTGQSFEEFLLNGIPEKPPKKSYADRNDSELELSSDEGLEEVGEEQIEEEEKESVLFYSETIEEEEEDEGGSKEFDPFADEEEILSLEGDPELKGKKSISEPRPSASAVGRPSASAVVPRPSKVHHSLTSTHSVSDEKEMKATVGIRKSSLKVKMSKDKIHSKEKIDSAGANARQSKVEGTETSQVKLESSPEHETSPATEASSSAAEVHQTDNN